MNEEVKQGRKKYAWLLVGDVTNHSATACGMWWWSANTNRKPNGNTNQLEGRDDYQAISRQPTVDAVMIPVPHAVSQRSDN